MAKKKSETFEDALKKLQAIVNRMERGDLPLEEAVESFSEGIRLVQYCHGRLEEAESKVQMLIQGRQDEFELTPFDSSPSDEKENE
ncbi:MAG: exodeoxyribonuclease VII small subunit [Syntrophobacteraceae bacterium]